MEVNHGSTKYVREKMRGKPEQCDVTHGNRKCEDGRTSHKGNFS